MRYIKYKAAFYLCPSIEALRRNRLTLQATETDFPIPPLGHNWISKFRKRHPSVNSVWTRQIDRSRIEGVQANNIIPWFAEIGSLMEEHKYKSSNVFNMDETGFGIGTTQSRRVLVVIEKGEVRGKATKAMPGRQEWVTLIECISADGIALPPLVIFRGEAGLNSGWLPTEQIAGTEDWRWSASKTGWSNNTMALEWLERVFIPITSPPLPLDPSSGLPLERRLLILDGHGSHVQARFIALCIQNSIDLVVLPSHSSHATQPLDKAVFGPFKQALCDQTDMYSRQNRGAVHKGRWADGLVLARSAAMTSKNIKAGFRETGLWPFSPSHAFPDIYNMLPSIPSTPHHSRTLSRTPHTSIALDNSEFMRQHEAILQTPIKKHVTSLVQALAEGEAAKAKVVILEKEIKELEAAQKLARKQKRGVTVKDMKTHVFTQTEVLEAIKGIEADRAAKKRKGKGKAVPEETEDAMEDNPFVSSA
ncbi:hypothetical protein TREMEDRAFT_68144 [Tremella mesenterica DSM 1558]|uniref:uncharacterized protein n=1 Tax=Tremella mesenterica (strain ATCC 24925 / CBS 8224 / DSM 1558 / NBRC 9311 / NRRL Y-6157 / RJB 2259-6 / UBC 559-6) TaxID=578456 RepID=UPI0003F49038|nr:uncharacterized protein TREMEDRAFT_68144 [Tremella mesenterica DSM 1558]EIW70637.1 hypothetical protein TREMEDRAFT_68144 [Tremella mesenterica DSM 1558]